MKKKLVSLALVLCMLLAFAPAALAAESDGVRETDFLTDQKHSDTNFADMEYVPVTEEEFTAAIDATKALLDDKANAAEAEECFNKVTELFQTISTDITLLNIRTSVDVTDKESQELYYETTALYRDIIDPFIYLIQDVLKSPCDKFLRDQLSEDDIEYYLAYGGQTEEQKALANQMDSIEEEYWEKYYDDYTYELDGVTWTDAEAQAAYQSGDLSEDDYTEISRAIAKDRNAAMGEVFMKGLELNTEYAASYGYDNYAEFSYIEEYNRDYTAEEVEAFADAVKEYIVPLANYVYTVFRYNLVNMSDEDYYKYVGTDYTTDEMLETIRPYIGKMSSELLEAYDYMLDHDLYDITARATKQNAGFTTIIPSYGAPFFFNMPYADPADFTTIIHEFGHYDNFYWHPSGWNDGSSDTDVAEVHSQAMELLFTEYYDDILGNASEVALDYLMYNLLDGAIITGSMYGELELYAASTPDVTLKQINEKYRELAGEYGLVDPSDPRTEMYGWIETHHLTTRPMYYISYATSAAGAMSFWLEEQENGMETAVDEYLKFVSQSVYEPFLAQFEAAGMGSPLDPDYVKELAETLYDVLDIEEQITDIVRQSYFEDVAKGSWYYDDVIAAYEYELVNGSQGRYNPDNKTTRAEFAQVLYNFAGDDEADAAQFADAAPNAWYLKAISWASANEIVKGSTENGQQVFKPNDNISRQDAALMLYRLAQGLGFVGKEPQDISSFKDAAKVAGYAKSAMEWAVGNDLVRGSYGELNPQGSLTRAEMAAVVMRLVNAVLAELSQQTTAGDVAA